MRNINFGNPPTGGLQAQITWLIACMRKIETASKDTDALTIADAYTVANAGGTRSIDGAASVAGTVRDVLATLLDDLKKRGSKRT